MPVALALPPPPPVAVTSPTEALELPTLLSFVILVQTSFVGLNMFLSLFLIMMLWWGFDGMPGLLGPPGPPGVEGGVEGPPGPPDPPPPPLAAFASATPNAMMITSDNTIASAQHVLWVVVLFVFMVLSLKNLE
jgi:hypothetical protein